MDDDFAGTVTVDAEAIPARGIIDDPGWNEEFERERDIAVSQQEEIYARALAIMVRPGRRLVTFGWALSCVLALMLISASLVGVVLAFDRNVPVETLSADASELNGIPPGGEGHIWYTVNRRRLCMAEAQRVFRDSGGERFIDPKDKPLRIPRAMPSDLGLQRFSVTVRIDQRMDPGKACGYVELNYFCNPLQHFLNWPIPDTTPRFCWNVGAVK